MRRKRDCTPGEGGGTPKEGERGKGGDSGSLAKKKGGKHHPGQFVKTKPFPGGEKFKKKPKTIKKGGGNRESREQGGGVSLIGQVFPFSKQKNGV